MSSDHFRIAHLSDPHFGTADPEKTTALLGALKALDPQLVAISGDITQRARRRQFSEARAFCNALSPVGVIAVPGNHDIPLFNLAARALWPYRGFRTVFGFPTSSRLSLGSVDILALNTTDPRRHIQGELRPEEARQLHSFSAAAKLRIAMFHHPMDCPKHVDEKNLLKNAEATHALLEEAKVDLVLGGHIHDPLTRLSSARYLSAKRPFVINVAGTCLSYRTRSGAPNSFNVVDVEHRGEDTVLTLTRYDLSLEHRFSSVSTKTFWREGRDIWQAGSS